MLQLDFRIDYDKKKIDKYAQQGVSIKPLMKRIPKEWERKTKEQFTSQSNPSGGKWASLKQSTLIQKSKRSRFKSAIGRDSGYGLSSLYEKTGEDFVEVGFKAPYMAIFHLGRQGVQQPRPIYIFSKSKELLDEQVEQLLKDFDRDWG